MDLMTTSLNFLDANLGSAVWFPFVLLGTGLFFTLYLGVPQIRFFLHAGRILTGRYDRGDAPGDTTHFRALATALSGTVGTGNIGGVALALHLGGPAALFWMWVTAFLGMTTKFVEVTLSWKYREMDTKGQVVGGPMYFMDRGLNMKWLAVFFAVATVVSSFGAGNMPQSNNMAAGIAGSFGIPPWATGLVFAGLLGLVIVGGIRRIALVTATLVPVMALLYTLGALAVLSSNLPAVGPAFLSVFTDAFSGSAAAGGFLGATFAYAFNRGVNRGLFSNEAGQGSAPIAHAAAKGDEPVSEGIVALLEPFIDTIVICTLTGLVILASGVWTEKLANDFQHTDMVIVAGNWDDQRDADVAELGAWLTGRDSRVTPFSGDVLVADGRIATDNLTVIHNRSVAENVLVTRNGSAHGGSIKVDRGVVADHTLRFSGSSLVHSVSLTRVAFTRSFLGHTGEYIVTLGLLLFAFSTAIAWSYYGDRAITYLFGSAFVLPYRIVYVGAFFVASIADTSLIWLVSYVTVALMTLPNLIGILLLRKEMRSTLAAYGTEFAKRTDEPR